MRRANVPELAGSGGPAPRSGGEWRRGGACLAGAVIGYGAGFGLFVFSANLFIEPMRAEFGWSSSEATFLPFSMLVLAGLFPVAGRLADRFGARPVALAGLSGFGVCFLLLAALPLTVTLLRIIAVLLGTCCAAAGAVPFGRAVASWFRENAGLALGIAGSGATLGGIVGVSFAAMMIGQFGWRSAYAGMAAITLLIGLPVTFRLLRQAEDHLTEAQSPATGTRATGLKAALPLSDTRFWLLAGSLTCSGIPIGIYLNHLQPILAERSFPLASIAMLGSAFAAATFGGRIAAGYLLDKAYPAFVAAGFLSLATIGALAVLGLDVPAAPLFAGALVLIGLAYGAEADFAAFFSLRFFGLARFSFTFGILAMMIALAVAAGGFLAAKAVDIFGSYHLALMLAPGGFGLAAVQMLCLARVRRASMEL